MKIADYIPITHDTAVYPTVVSNFGGAYLYIGLVDEYEEFRTAFSTAVDLTDASIPKEAGDVIWYVTSLSEFFGLDTNEILSIDAYDISTWDFNLYSIAGNIKKFYRDKKPTDIEKFTKSLQSVVANVKARLEKTPYHFEAVLEMNFNKLKKRQLENTLHGDGDNR